MARPRSITGGLMARIAVVFALSPLIAIPVLLLIDDETPDLRIEQDMEEQADVLAPLLAPDAQGKIALPVAAIQAKPVLAQLRFAIYNGGSNTPVVRWPADLVLHNWDYHDSYDTFRASRFGPLRILFLSPGKSAGWVDWLEDELLTEFFPVLAIMLVLAMPLTVYSVRRSLAPMRRVAVEVASLEPGLGKAKLTEAGAPLELVPLISAINRGLERIETVFAAQRHFSAVVAHELRSPLAALSASLELQPVNGHSAEIRNKLRGMSKLIGQLLVHSELSSRRLKLDRIADLRKVVGEAVADETPEAVKRGVSLELNAPEKRVPLRGSAPAIATAVRNLIENAVRHSPKHGVVTITVGVEGPSIEVADMGSGIPPDQREAVFTPFWRGADSPGTGLGLAIVRQMVELHNARITIRDNLPVGTVFRIVFQPE